MTRRILHGIVIKLILFPLPRLYRYKAIKLRSLNTQAIFHLSLDMLQDHLHYSLLRLSNKTRFLSLLLRNQNGLQTFPCKIHLLLTHHSHIPLRLLLQKLSKNPGCLHFHLWKLNTPYQLIKVPTLFFWKTNNIPFLSLIIPNPPFWKKQQQPKSLLTSPMNQQNQQYNLHQLIQAIYLIHKKLLKCLKNHRNILVWNLGCFHLVKK